MWLAPDEAGFTQGEILFEQIIRAVSVGVCSGAFSFADRPVLVRYVVTKLSQWVLNNGTNDNNKLSRDIVSWMWTFIFNTLSSTKVLILGD